jgi:DNA replication and repair protein RecF
MFLSLKPYQFRNLADETILLDAQQIIVEGSNGQGKTNFLEALYFMSLSASFRETKENKLARFGFFDFAVIGHFSHIYGVDKLTVGKREGQKFIKRNDELIKDRKELLHRYPCVAFVNNDLILADGEPSIRRRFFDQILSLLYPGYVDVLRKYTHILKQKNSALKQRSKNVVSVLNQQLVHYGFSLNSYRSQLLVDFNQKFNDLFTKTTNEKLNLHFEYQPGWRGQTIGDIEYFLDQKKTQELKQGMTLYGPHRDRYTLCQDTIEFASFLSTGQKRLVSLVMKSLAAQLVAEYTHEKPILLLDDVLLELDSEHTQQFLKNLPPYRQVYYAFLPQKTAYFRTDQRFLRYSMVRGKLSYIKGLF